MIKGIKIHVCYGSICNTHFVRKSKRRKLHPFVYMNVSSLSIISCEHHILCAFCDNVE
jgi:hypothetical protein